MESSTVTHQPHGSAVEANEPVAHTSAGPASRARRRGTVLATMLFAGDSLAAAAAAALAVTVLGLVTPGGFAFLVCVTALWPLAALSIGLYRTDQLATWASAVSELPRAFVAILLITWPLFGIASGFQLTHVVALTFLTVAGIAGFTGIARTVVRSGLHRARDLKQRTLILGSGIVAGQVVDKLDK